MSIERKSLKELAQSMTTILPFMEGKTKADQKDLIGEIVTIREYGFMAGDNGDFAVFTTDEYPDKFFFAGQVLTKHLKAIDDAGYHDDTVAEGLPTLFSVKKSKNKMIYTNVSFYPESAK